MLNKITLCMVAAILASPTLHAQVENVDKRDGRRSDAMVDADATKNKKTTVNVDAFVAEHLPELTKLLDYLKKQGKEQYQRAARDLERSIGRIENLQKRDEKLYAVELELWKTRSRLQFAAAEMAVRPHKDEDVTTQRLRKLLKKKTELELDRLRILRAKAAEQLAELDKQIAQREHDLEDEKLVEDLAEQYKRRYRAANKK